MEPPSVEQGGTWVALITMAGAAAKWLWETVRERKREAEAAPERKTDANMLSLERTRAALERDNALLRETLQEERDQAQRERDQHARDRAEWRQERAELHDEVERLQQVVEQQAADAARRYEALLRQVTDLKARHGFPES